MSWPGISDHEAVCVECLLNVKFTSSIERNIYLWSKADFTMINQLVNEFATTFLDNTIDTPVQDLWDAYKAMCMNCLQLVPTKSACFRKFDQPWVISLIRRLSSKNNACIIVLRGVVFLMTGKNTMLLKNSCRRSVDKLITGFCVRYLILILTEVTKTYGPTGCMLNVNGVIK